MENIETQSIVTNWPQILAGFLLIVTIAGIFLGFTKKAIYYLDYNDLGISAAVFAAPFAIAIIAIQFGLDGTISFWAALGVFLILFCLTIYKTWTANQRKVLISIIVSISKLVMSFLYIIYLFEALTGKKRQSRGAAWFMLAIFTPMLIALVHTQEGAFRLRSSGRPFV